MRLRLIAVAAAVAAMPALAQEAEEDYDPGQFDAAHGKEVYTDEGICTQCHGWDGSGLGRNPRAPAGPNLRETSLDAYLLREVVVCGRPYTEMPYHDTAAYSDGRCYGMTMADFEEDVAAAPTRGNTLSDQEIDDLVAYLVTAVVGQGEATLADCEAFFRPGHRNCRGLPE